MKDEQIADPAVSSEKTTNMLLINPVNPVNPV
jgi:hypothetical protein